MASQNKDQILLSTGCVSVNTFQPMGHKEKQYVNLWWGVSSPLSFLFSLSVIRISINFDFLIPPKLETYTVGILTLLVRNLRHRGARHLIKDT